MPKIPQPFPYQGSKRKLASRILQCIPSDCETLFEPFAGSAAVSVAAALNAASKRFALNDSNPAIADLWRAILNRPQELASEYEQLWNEQAGDERAYYDRVRDRFNRSPDSASFLFLLARCVKGAIRYNKQGKFNQSPDNRRRGMKPSTMASNVMSIHTLLTPATVTNLDYVDAVEDAAASDVIYMDPPYQGVSGNRDARYVTGLPYEDFVEALYKFNQRGLSYVISYDGQTGDKMHGKRLPPQLGLELVELKAGKSTTATLLGRDESTTESLYLSAPLVDRLDGLPAILKKPESQHKIQFTHG